jgi:hypothetical protein
MSVAARVTALRNDSRQDLGRIRLRVGAHDYLVLKSIASGARAEVCVCVPESASSLDELLVVKRFDPEIAVAEWTRLVAELELMKQLQHEHIVRTLELCLEPAACCWVQEYLEGATLRATLGSAVAQGLRLPNPVLARILLAILQAVVHAEGNAPSELCRSLVRAPVGAEDVFLTQDGQVKVLGFKRTAASASSAIDALFEQQWTPELGTMLESLPCRGDLSAREWSESVVQALRRWQAERLGSDGRAELTRWLRNVQRQERAQQAMRLVAEFSRLRGRQLKFRIGGDAEEALAQSGYRRVGTLAPPSSEAPSTLGGAVDVEQAPDAIGGMLR